MRRSLWSRLIAGWLACWLPLVLADAGWLHACPMHDGPAMMATMAVGAAQSVTAGHEMRSVVAGDAAHRGTHETGVKGHCCTCLGACSGAAVALPSGTAPVTLGVVAQAPVASTGRPEHEYVAAWVDFVLPFATAPPALS